MAEYSLEQAKILFEEGNLMEARTHCFWVQRGEGEDAAEAYLLCAKIDLTEAGTIPDPDDDAAKSYVNSLFLACDAAQSVPQLKQLLAQAEEDLFSLTYACQRALLAQWAEDLRDTSYGQKIMQLHLNALKIKLQTTTRLNLCKGLWNTLGKDKGMTDEEISSAQFASFNLLGAAVRAASAGQSAPQAPREKSMVAKFLEENRTDETDLLYRAKLSEDIRDVAGAIFQGTLDDIQENNVVPGEYVAARSQEWSQGLIAPLLMMTVAVLSLDKKQKEERLSMLSEKAIMLVKELNATYVVNGKLLFVLRDQLRTDKIADLKKTYEDIKALNPDFVVPDLPQGNTSSAANSQKSGCYVATCVYGSYDCPEVWTLRRYRDHVLAESTMGRAFIRAYYAVSPTVVRIFGGNRVFRAFFRKKLDRMVASLRRSGMSSEPYEDKKW